MEDRILVEIALGSTLLFLFCAYSLRTRSSLIINAVFLMIIAIAFYALAIRSKKHPFDTPTILWNRLFDGTDRRICLLIFWSICVLSSLIFCTVVSVCGDRISTIHRKFFHLSVSLICITGLRYDAELLWLSAWLTLCIFVILEVFRSFQVAPWNAFLNNGLLVFVDSQDSKSLILTPIYLLAGIFLPVFLSPLNNFQPVHLYHYAGVLTVGVGDSVAAIVGSKYGVRCWRGSMKTKEGSLAMLLSQFLVGIYVSLYWTTEQYDWNMISLLRLFVTCIVCTIAEANLRNIDNIALPLIAYFML